MAVILTVLKLHRGVTVAALVGGVPRRHEKIVVQVTDQQRTGRVAEVARGGEDKTVPVQETEMLKVFGSWQSFCQI